MPAIKKMAAKSAIAVIAIHCRLRVIVRASIAEAGVYTRWGKSREMRPRSREVAKADAKELPVRSQRKTEPRALRTKEDKQKKSQTQGALPPAPPEVYRFGSHRQEKWLD